MLELGSVSVAFEPETLQNEQSGNITQNFFDDVNLKICTVRNNGSLGITAKSLAENDVISARTKDRGPPGLMKLSPNGKFAILQRQINSVDIILLEKNDGTTAVEFNVPTKSKDMILSVDWITNSQPLGRSFMSANSSLIILATGINCTTLQPFLIQHGQFTRLKSFDVDSSTPLSENLLEKDVTITSIYGKVCVMVLRYSAGGSNATDLMIYELTSDIQCAAKMKYSLALGCSGGFGIHVIDNLIIVHHQVTAKSMIFDVALSPNRPTHSPLIITSIRPSPICQPPPALYVPLWSMFQPDIVVDPVAGMMYQLTVRCDRAPEVIVDKCTLVEFLIHRTNQKSLVLSTLLDCLKHKMLRLRQVRKLFDLIVEKFTLSLAAEANHTESTKSQLIPVDVEHMRIEQAEMQSSIFIPLMESSMKDSKYAADIMLQYLRSLHRHFVPIEAYFLELVVESLASSGEMSKLHQLVTYKVIFDSKPLAFLLLSYEARCPSLFQSGIDILARQKACDEIVEVLLERGHVVDAMSSLYTSEEIKEAVDEVSKAA
ncbi:unnamed protein product [Haemonchus placei]|uniref:Mic1 domain-containing protein n=1 Tax=Haemonchus placei TaxID=6290 RepID=A0A158QJQ7_HAEPC|nr:unnamed protein product [Haemonchus placei]